MNTNMSNTAEKASNTAVARIHELMQDVEGLVSRVADIKDPQISAVRSKVEQALQGTRDALSQRTEALRDRGARAADITVDFVVENPWKALGIASLVGITVALLAVRRSTAVATHSGRRD